MGLEWVIGILVARKEISVKARNMQGGALVPRLIHIVLLLTWRRGEEVLVKSETVTLVELDNDVVLNCLVF